MARSFKGRSSISAATSRVFVSTGPGGTIGVEIPYLASAIGEGVGSVPSLVGTTSHRQSKMMEKKQQETPTTIALWAVLPWEQNNFSQHALGGSPRLSFSGLLLPRPHCWIPASLRCQTGKVSGTEEP